MLRLAWYVVGNKLDAMSGAINFERASILSMFWKGGSKVK